MQWGSFSAQLPPGVGVKCGDVNPALPNTSFQLWIAGRTAASSAFEFSVEYTTAISWPSVGKRSKLPASLGLHCGAHATMTAVFGTRSEYITSVQTVG